MRDVVKLRIETSGEHYNDESVLTVCFLAGVKKLQKLKVAACCQKSADRLDQPLPAIRRNQAATELARQRKKIAGLIKSLDLNRQQVDAIVQRQQEFCDRAKALQEILAGQSSQEKEILALEKVVGMSTQEECVAFSAFQFSVPVKDTDRDGLLNIWESPQAAGLLDPARQSADPEPVRDACPRRHPGHLSRSRIHDRGSEHPLRSTTGRPV